MEIPEGHFRHILLFTSEKGKMQRRLIENGVVFIVMSA